MKFIELFANFLSELVGEPVSNLAAGGVIAVIIICFIMLIFGMAWTSSESKQWEEIAKDADWYKDED
jgi:hypothetical protein